MRVLLDTHSFLWFVEGSPRLSARARSTIEDVGNDRYLSVAGVWEIAIKVRLGKLSITAPLQDCLLEHLDRSITNLLGITLLHATRVADLPLHHRDPFDRLLIAQAIVEDMQSSALTRLSMPIQSHASGDRSRQRDGYHSREPALNQTPAQPHARSATL